MKKLREKKSIISPESESIEHKQSLAEWKEIVETCAAFATAKGGRIYVGVSPKGESVGLQIGKGTLEDIANKISQNTNPRLVPSISVLKRDGKTLITIEVSENSNKPVFAFNRAYRRSGRTNQFLSPSEIADIYYDTRGLTWDSTPLKDTSIKDVNPTIIRNFIQQARAERRWNVDVNTPVPKVLKQLGLIKQGRLTIAGLLLFGKDPQRLMPQATLRCARFKGDSTEVFLDLKAMEGDILDQVEEAMTFIKRNIRMGARITGKPQREEVWEYPLDAVREAVINAVCHRDYASTANVQVRIFDNALEVWNPGVLPSGLTVSDLKKEHESIPRNKSIARAFFLIRFIEQFGTGTRRIFQDCRDAGLPAPEFKSRPNTFRIIFKKGKGSSRDQEGPKSGLSGAQVGTKSEMNPDQVKILKLARQARPLSFFMRSFGRTNKTKFREKVIKPLVENGLMSLTIPDRPNSRLQKYVTTPTGKAFLKENSGR